MRTAILLVAVLAGAGCVDRGGHDEPSATTSCTACHGGPTSIAPPPDTAGNTDVASPGVGAHQVHLSGGASSRPLGCDECHVVPATADAPGHLDATPDTVVTFSGIALTAIATPAFDSAALTCNATFCHGPADAANSVSPVWTRTAGRLGCTDCHGFPPAAPHEQASSDCSTCHSNVTPTLTFVDRNLHVNGVVNF